MNSKVKEPPFHIIKRADISKAEAWAIRLIAIVIALIFCALLTTVFTGQNPMSVFSAAIEGAFGTERKVWVTLQNVGILLIISLALTPAFKMQFWNIGGEGQVIIGALAAATCMIKLSDRMSNAGVICMMIITSLIAGAVWGLIPAIFKALWNTNETLSTLMMNYIAIQIVSYYSVVWENPEGSGSIGVINSQTSIGWFPDIAGNKFVLTVIVALLVTLFMYVYLNYSKHGYEIAVVGQSQNTARYAGIKVEKVIIRTMALSGALCGLAGLLLVGGINHTVFSNIADGQGFTGVMVSWLAKFNPLAMIATSFLLIFMDRGASEISSSCGLNESFSDVLTAIILFFIIGCEFFIRYKISINKKKEEQK